MRRPATRRACAWVVPFLAAVVLACVPATAWTEAAASKEFQIKAAFLFNFTQFVEWPAGAFADGDAPIRIGILGDDPFGTALDDTIRDEKVQNRRLAVKRARRIGDLADCQLVYISESEKEHLRLILAETTNRAVLTVSDIEGFAGQGGAIRFYLAGKKVRFEINPGVAQQHSLKVSAQLLNLGKITKPDKAGGG